MKNSQVFIEKLALNTRLSKLKPLLRQMSDDGVKLNRPTSNNPLKSSI